MEKTTLPPFVGFVSQTEVTRYSPTFIINVGQLGEAKRGDWVRLMVRFPHKCEYCGKAPSCGKEGKTDYEVLSAKLWAGIGAASLAKLKILSRPSYTALHSLDFSDDLTVSATYLLDYVPLPIERVADEDYLLTGVMPEAKHIFRKDELRPGEAPRPLYDGQTEDRKLRDRTKNLPPLAPSLDPGGKAKRFWLRNGAVAMVWTERAGTWYGRTDDGAELEWTLAGAHKDGNRDLDIVKDPKLTEVINA